MRQADAYLKDIQDGRTVIVDGQRVANVMADPRFRGIAGTIASMYDFAADPANDMQFDCAETGGPALKPYLIPRSPADLADRAEAIRKWSSLTAGFVGRGPDHVAGLFAGFAGAPEVFRRDTHDGSASVLTWYRRIVAGSLFVTYAITPPQTSRADDDTDGPLQVAVTGKDERGITVRGAQMLATSAAV